MTPSNNTTPKTSVRTYILIGVGLLAVILAASAAISYRDLLEYGDSANWRTTLATRLQNSRDSSFLKYEYDVDGRSFTSTRSFFFERLMPTSPARTLRRQYPVGSKFNILYDPASPDRSVVSREIPVGKVLTSSARMILVIGAAGLGLLFLNRRKKKQTAETASPVG